MGRWHVSKSERVNPRALPRFFVSEETLKAGTLPDPVAHQVTHVLRLRAGDPLCLLDGNGGVFIAHLREGRRFQVVEQVPPPPEPPIAITLLQALVRPEKLEQVIRLGVQSGASALWIAPSERSVVRVEPSKQSSRLIRWQKIATEEAELAYRAQVPEVKLFDEWCQAFQSLPRPIWVLDEWEGMVPLSQCLSGVPPSTLSLVVGPEGGFSPHEREWMRSQPDCKAVSLGARVLRTESAGFYALAQIWALVEANPQASWGGELSP